MFCWCSCHEYGKVELSPGDSVGTMLLACILVVCPSLAAPRMGARLWNDEDDDDDTIPAFDAVVLVLGLGLVCMLVFDDWLFWLCIVFLTAAPTLMCGLWALLAFGSFATATPVPVLVPLPVIASRKKTGPTPS